MATITTRSGKGSPLTNSEVDANFTNLNSDKIELTNLSITTASASGGGSLAYANGSGVFTFTPPDLTSFLTSLSSNDTDDLSEGSSNLYFTNARARGAVSVTDSGGDGSLAYNSSTGVITYTGPSASEVRAHISGGTGVTVTSGEIAIGQAVATTSNVTFNNIIASGNLTVNGTTTTVNSTTVTVDDPIFTLGGDTAPASDDNKDRGIEFRWHNGSAAKVGFFGYDDSAGAFTFIQDATNSSEVFSGTAGDVVFGGATVSSLTLGSTAITATGAEINYIDGVTSNVQTQLDAKQASDAQLTDIAGLTPSDGGFIVGDGSNFVLESGATARASLGLTIGTHVLAYDSNLQSFVTAFTLPTSDGTSGQALTTNGSGTLAFSDVDALPSQSGNSGYYLTTDGSSASWDNLTDDPTFTGTVTVNSTEALTLPAGTTAQRPTAATGMLRYNSTLSKVEFYNGSAWSNINIDNVYTRTNITATSGQTSFSVSYDVGYVDVFLNGVKLISGTEFTATSGSAIVLASGAATGDLFEAIAWNKSDVQQNAYTRTSYTATNAQTTFSATYTVGLVNVYMNGVLLLDGTDYTATNGTSIVLAAGAATGDSIVIEAFSTFSVSSALAKTSNLSDLASASTAITNLGITATAAELNVLDGVTATTAELNYVDGVTSNIQTQLDNKVSTLGTLTKTFLTNEEATITLTSNVVAPVVAVTKEVSQSGTTNNYWDVNSTDENYIRYNSAPATTLDFAGFDVSNASYSQSFSTSSQDTHAQDVQFNADGTKMFVLGNAGDDVNEYALTTGFDVSTASYTRNFSVSSQETNPKGLAFNTDGTKMFVAGNGTNAVYLYNLTTGFDLSTASYSSTSLSLSSQNTTTADVMFNDDGTKMYIIDSNDQQINEYALSTAFDISSASYTDNYSVSSQEFTPTGLAFNSNGTKMFVVGETGADVNEYALSTAYDVSSASYTQNFDVSSQESTITGISLNTDGTKMFVIGEGGDAVFEYDISRSFVLGSGSFASADVGKTIFANSGVFILTSTGGGFSQTTAPSSFNQVASGSWEMYAVVYNTTDGDLELSKYAAGFAAISGWSYASKSFSVSSQNSSPQGVTLNADGTKMYMMGGNTIYQYTLSTAFDISTASYDSVSFSTSSQQPTNRAVIFNNDGTSMYTTGNNGTSLVVQYTLTTAYDISTAAFVGNKSVNVKTQELYPSDVIFNSDGTSMYVVGSGSDTVYQYTLSTAFDVSTASYASKSMSVASQENTPQGMTWNGDGTKLYVVGEQNDTIYEYALTTAYDVSTGSYNSASFSVSSQESTPTGIAFGDSGQKLYVVGSGSDTVYQYTTGSTSIPSGYHAVHTKNSTDSTYWTDINSMTVDESAGSGAIYYCVSTDDRTTWKIAKGTDGERNIAKNSSGTWQYNSNATYGSETWTNATVNSELYAIQEAVAYSNTVTTTSGADDLAVVSLTTSKDVSGQTSGPEALTFNPAGTRMIVGSTSGNNILEYHLSTAFDLSTASYDSAYSVSGSVGRVDGIAFSSDGTHMYVVGYSSNNIHQFSLSTGFDVSTASPVRTLAINTYQTGVRGVQINNNGTKIYTISDSDDQIEEWSLSTAYDISTASHESSTSISSQSGNAQGFCFNGDGTILFVCDETDSSGTVYQYSLSTAYDTSTLSYASKSYATGNGIAAVFVTADGSKMFGGMNGDDTIKEYALEQTTTTTTFPNQMNKTQLEAIPDANHFALANDLDLGMIFNLSSGSNVPSSDGVSINYDAAVLNKGAILGTDYDFDAPAQNKVRITALAGNNLKIRVT